VASFYVENFGCRATQSDGAALERQFVERGLTPADSRDAAQIVVLNTCTVTAAADQDARAAIRRIHRQNPGCQIVVTGCYAQRAPDEIALLPGVSKVIGNSNKHELAKLALPSISPAFVPLSSLTIDGMTGREPRRENLPFFANHQPQTTNAIPPRTHDRRLTTIHVSDIFAHTELLAAPVFEAANERTRPNLKVQDGCDNRCSFCVIPYVRGQSRSLKQDSVIREVQQLVETGYREVVISGINLGRWGQDLPAISPHAAIIGPEPPALGSSNKGQSRNREPRTEHDRTSGQSWKLVDLIQAILDQTSLEKLRISSVEPMDWSDELIDLLANSPRIAKHAHVPMQSGSDRILRAMHRKYRPWHYREKIQKIRAAVPAAAIGADVMVGFPGETDADFEETRRMIEELPFTYLHVFTYSARPGTPAESLPSQVPVHVARERNRTLRDLASTKKLAFMRSFIGKNIQAITLNVFDGEYTEALTDNYLKLRLAGKHAANQWMEVKVDEVVSGVMLSRSGNHKD
jgi:threonylcarbamoyladenosine tRNA methylthiotransferase MtaB